MALTDAERLYVFEIFDFPPTAEVFQLWGPLGQANAVQQYSFRAPSEAIDTLLGPLTPAQEEIVRGLTQEWVPVRTRELKLTKAEGAEGVVTDAAAKRALIRERLQTHVPLFLEGEIQALQDKRSPSGRVRRS